MCFNPLKEISQIAKGIINVNTRSILPCLNDTYHLKLPSFVMIHIGMKKLFLKIFPKLNKNNQYFKLID